MTEQQTITIPLTVHVVIVDGQANVTVEVDVERAQ